MRLMLHTFRKDFRRLWPAASVTWVMLAWLTRMDRWRADWVVSPTESWMNMLLTLSWVLLAGLAVLEEPLVGDRNFWTTRPHRWPALLASKVVFVLMAIHVPSLLADIFILTARGFPTGPELGRLMAKQALLLGAVILPAMALASVVRSFTHFVIAVFSIAAGIAILNGGFQRFPDFRREGADVRHGVVRVVIAVTALAAMWWQYARRSVIAARAMAVSGALAAASLSTWMPARAEYALSGRVAETRITLGNHPLPPELRGNYYVMQPTALLPIAIVTPAPGLFHIAFVELEIVAADGSRLESVRPSPNRPFEKAGLTAYPYVPPKDPAASWLSLRFSRRVWDQFQSRPVRIRGVTAFDFYRLGPTGVLPFGGTAEVPNLGRCTATIVEDRFAEDMLKIFCESTRAVPAAALVVKHEGTAREWRQRLNSAVTYSPGPHLTWLSPLDRAQSFFPLTNSAEYRPGYGLEIPASYVESTRVEITPEIVTGHALVPFDLGEVTLSSWLGHR